MTLTETSWTPPLTDLPASAEVLLRGVRLSIPGLAQHIRLAPTEQTPDVTISMPLDDNGRVAAFRLRGFDTRRSELGPRDSLIFSLVGEAVVDGRSIPIAGHCALDLATYAMLDVSLTSPVSTA